jgi:2-amino-4-hydroxy-6-hydroxymethyldihydropteridine diphosphokinase
VAQAYVSIGSNVEPRRHIDAALEDLRARYADLTVSRFYESRAVGFEGENFVNLVVGFVTDEPVHALAERLRELEVQHGRRRGSARFAPRTLDLDLLLYDDLVLRDGVVVVPREDILRYAFVLRPLAEIAPERRHPVDGRRYAELWEAFDRHPHGQDLWPVEDR